MAKQKAQGNRPRVDYIFDVPIELAAVVAGFHYLRGTSGGYPDLEGLEMAVMPSSPGETVVASSASLVVYKIFRVSEGCSPKNHEPTLQELQPGNFGWHPSAAEQWLIESPQLPSAPSVLDMNE